MARAYPIFLLIVLPSMGWAADLTLPATHAGAPPVTQASTLPTIRFASNQQRILSLTLEQAQRLALTQNSIAHNATMFDDADFNLLSQINRSAQDNAGAPANNPTQALEKLLHIVQPVLKSTNPANSALQGDITRLNDQFGNYQRTLALDTLYADVTLAYYKALQAHKQAFVAERSMERLQKLHRTNQHLRDAGRITKQESQQATANIKQSAIPLAQLRSTEKTAYNNLLQLLGSAISNQPNITLNLVEDTSPLDPAIPLEEDAFNRAQTLRDDLQVARQAVEIARQSQQLAEDDLAPQVGLGSGSSSDSRIRSLGLKLNISLDRGNLKQQHVHYKASLRKAELALQDMETLVQNEVKNALQELQFSMRQYQLTQSAANLYRHKFQAENVKYLTGRYPHAYEVTSALQALNNSELSLAQTRFAVERAILQLDKVSGAITHLRLRVAN